MASQIEVEACLGLKCWYLWTDRDAIGDKKDNKESGTGPQLWAACLESSTVACSDNFAHFSGCSRLLSFLLAHGFSFWHFVQTWLRGTQMGALPLGYHTMACLLLTLALRCRVFLAILWTLATGQKLSVMSMTVLTVELFIGCESRCTQHLLGRCFLYAVWLVCSAFLFFLLVSFSLQYYHHFYV